jgi:hypothetical protein
MIMGHCGLRNSSAKSRPALLDLDYASDELALAKILIPTPATRTGGDPDDGQFRFRIGFDADARYGSDNIVAD